VVVHELQQLKKLIFGSKHERFIPENNNPSQLSLNIEARVVAACSITDAKYPSEQLHLV
jgi:hypothetical protein